MVSLWKRKFKNFETRGSIKIIFSHVKNLTQQTKINECFRNRLVIEYKIPQGLVLSLLLFNINVIDILYSDEDNQIKNYADETTP